MSVHSQFTSREETVLTPASQDRRGRRREEDDTGGDRLLRRHLRPSEVLAAITVLGMLLTLLGFRFISISSLDSRVTKLESDNVMNSYILCVLVRRSDPEASPPNCEPLIREHEARTAK